MKHIAILLFLILSGCTDESNDNTGSPVIHEIRYYAAGSNISRTNFQIGDSVRIEIDVEDADLDIESINIREYQLPEGELVAEVDFELDEQTDKTGTYTVNAGEVLPPAGTFVDYYIIKDRKNNESNEASVEYTISE
jgi:hypothetical protein